MQWGSGSLRGRKTEPEPRDAAFSTLAGRSTHAHLSPLLEDLVAEALNVLELAHVGGHDEHVLLAYELHALGTSILEALGVDVGKGNAEALPV